MEEEEGMAKAGNVWLDAGDAFPEMDMALVSGETCLLPGSTGAGYGVVLLYRGHW
jgi:hypothetical protein